MDLIPNPTETRRALWQMLGDIPAPFLPQAQLIAKRDEPTFRLSA